jgi:hypothetical protein
VVSDNILIITLRRSATSALIPTKLLLKVNKYANISPAVIANQLLRERILIAEVGLILTSTVVSLRGEIVNENSNVNIICP